ncbi:MAG: cob(I)yrinic acid a,c-diamide adenosyltransferase [Peptococcaceae bacterium]|nr:cob(I)yrinic acid a,c-diamide adenosyltransferase [Peptococcaceae bacterium]
MEHKGIVMVYTGDGKGKTTAALGLILRAVGHKHKVAFVQFMKGQQTGEVEALSRYIPEVGIFRFGRDVFVDPNSPDPEDERLAREGFLTVVELLGTDLDLLVLDEVNVAMSLGLVPAALLVDAVKQRNKKMTVVLTGRGLPSLVEDIADMISEVREVRHHWRKGIPAQDGIEQ